MNQLTVKQWAEDDRPREKMLLKGRGALSDAELIAILFGSGSREKSAVELAKEILNKSHNDLARLSRLSCAELTEHKGVGQAKAISLMAAMELGRRRMSAEKNEETKIVSSNQAYQLFRPFLTDLPHEEFYVLYLTAANTLLSCEQLSKGGMTGTVADGKLLFKRALQLSASGVILGHNHPSGNLKASEADIRLTKNLTEFGKMVDITILDHLIITDYGYLSFSDQQIV
ncbi:MAG: DNA repair protein RadC [Bacteroidetes bacterium]|nr:DNA repair protein RadC [Bacteroidota bacterium]